MRELERRIGPLKIAIAAAALGYVGLSLWSGWSQVLRAIAAAGATGVVFGLGAALVNIGLRFMRWQSYLDCLGHRVPRAASLRIFVAGFALATTPGAMGEAAVRGVLLRPFGLGYTQTFAAYVSERLSDLVCVLALTGAGLLAYPPARPFVVAAAGLVVAAVLTIRHGRWITQVKEWLGHKRGLFSRLAYGVIQTIDHSRHCMSPAVLVKGILWGLPAWAATGLAFHYVLGQVVGETSLATALFIYTFSILVGGLSFLPGGLGSAEATMIGLLLMHGAGQPQAVAVTIFTRLMTLWFAVALGVWSLSGHSAPASVPGTSNAD